MRYFTSFLLILVVIAGSLVAFVPEVRNWSMQQAGLMTLTEHQQVVDDLTNQIDDLEGQIDEKQTSINSLNNVGYSIYSAVAGDTTFATINEYLSAGGIELTVSSVTSLVDAYDELAGDTTLIDTVADVNDLLQSAIQIEYEPAENETETEILINSTLAGVSQLSTSYSTLQSELTAAQQRILDLEREIDELEGSTSAVPTYERNWQINYYFENGSYHLQSNSGSNEYQTGSSSASNSMIARACVYATDSCTYKPYHDLPLIFIISLDSDMACYEDWKDAYGVKYEFNATLTMSSQSGYAATYVAGYFQNQYSIQSFWNQVYKAYLPINFGMSGAISDYGLLDIVTYDFVFEYGGQTAIHIIDHVYINHLTDGNSADLTNFNLI